MYARGAGAGGVGEGGRQGRAVAWHLADLSLRASRAVSRRERCIPTSGASVLAGYDWMQGAGGSERIRAWRGVKALQLARIPMRLHGPC